MLLILFTFIVIMIVIGGVRGCTRLLDWLDTNTEYHDDHEWRNQG